MPKLGPIKHKQLIKYLRQLGFDGPYGRGGKHDVMIKGDLTLTIPTKHGSGVINDVGLFKENSKAGRHFDRGLGKTQVSYATANSTVSLWRPTAGTFRPREIRNKSQVSSASANSSRQSSRLFALAHTPLKPGISP